MRDAAPPTQPRGHRLSFRWNLTTPVHAATECRTRPSSGPVDGEVRRCPLWTAYPNTDATRARTKGTTVVRTKAGRKAKPRAAPGHAERRDPRIEITVGPRTEPPRPRRGSGRPLGRPPQWPGRLPASPFHAGDTCAQHWSGPRPQRNPVVTVRKPVEPPRLGSRRSPPRSRRSGRSRRTAPWQPATSRRRHGRPWAALPLPAHERSRPSGRPMRPPPDAPPDPAQCPTPRPRHGPAVAGPSDDRGSGQVRTDARARTAPMSGATAALLTRGAARRALAAPDGSARPTTGGPATGAGPRQGPPPGPPGWPKDGRGRRAPPWQGARESAAP